LLLGELPDRFQHRKPGVPGRAIRHQQRLSHQRIQQIQHGEVVDVVGYGYRAGTFDLETACKN
jgi:hypothetical protein